MSEHRMVDSQIWSKGVIFPQVKLAGAMRRGRLPSFVVWVMTYFPRTSGDILPNESNPETIAGVQCIGSFLSLSCFIFLKHIAIFEAFWLRSVRVFSVVCSVHGRSGQRSGCSCGLLGLSWLSVHHVVTWNCRGLDSITQVFISSPIFLGVFLPTEAQLCCRSPLAEPSLFWALRSKRIKKGKERLHFDLHGVFFRALIS